MESEALLSFEFEGRPPYAGIPAYEFVVHVSKKLNSRQAKKAICQGLLQINGETISHPYFPLRVDDDVDFWNRKYRISMEKDGIPKMLRVGVGD